MIPTLKISDIISKWRTALETSSSIQNFCTTKYNKSPKIYIGINGKNPPLDSDCPMIIIYPGTKSEGLEMMEYTYKIPISWAIVQNATTTTNDTTEYMGVSECDELGQLIYLELAELEAANPISKVYYTTEPVAYFPRFPGRMDIILKITPTNGYNIEY